MPQDISILEDHVINQIAAGEVIESPSSVIKELIDNSLDAKSNNIEIKIKAGGLQLISVSDDGIGMKKEDLKRSIIRHATSKIKTIDDLKKIQTMGFRGEALASLASISRLKITSYRDKAYSLSAEGGKIISFYEDAREKGTFVEARSLFYNVPARKKFQKSINNITKEIVKTINKLAICYPYCSFLLYSDEKKLLDIQGGSFKKRIEDLFSKDLFSFLKKIEIKEKGISFKGYVGNPSFTKHNRSSQYIFINKRAVSSDLISQAVKDGYGTRIKEMEYPFFILDMEIDQNYIDVNVHPQKKYVRISQEEMVYETLKKAVGDLFLENLEEKRSFTKELFFYKNISFEEVKKEEKTYEQKDIFSEEIFYEIALISNYYLIGIIKNSEVMCVDLKSAFFRIFYENIKSSKKIEKQILAIPFILDFSEDEILFLEGIKKDLFSLGFDIKLIGKKSIAIDSIPYFFDKKDISLFFSNILENKIYDIKTERKAIRKMCIMRKKSFTSQEARNIVKKLFKCQEPFLDPLGFKIMVPLDFSKLFKKDVLYKKSRKTTK